MAERARDNFGNACAEKEQKSEPTLSKKSELCLGSSRLLNNSFTLFL